MGFFDKLSAFVDELLGSKQQPPQTTSTLPIAPTQPDATEPLPTLTPIEPIAPIVTAEPAPSPTIEPVAAIPALTPTQPIAISQPETTQPAPAPIIAPAPTIEPVLKLDAIQPVAVSQPEQPAAPVQAPPTPPPEPSYLPSEYTVEIQADPAPPESFWSMGWYVFDYDPRGQGEPYNQNPQRQENFNNYNNMWRINLPAGTYYFTIDGDGWSGTINGVHYAIGRGEAVEFTVG